jgi:hypothetical protein
MNERPYITKFLGKVARVIVIAGAWLSICLSILILLLVLVGTSWDDPNDWSAFFQSNFNGVARSAWGLYYYGYSGLFVVFFETVILVAALWISTRQNDIKRRIGLIIIAGWALLLLVGGFSVFPNTFVPFLVSPILFFTIGRTIYCWNRFS